MIDADNAGDARRMICVDDADADDEEARIGGQEVDIVSNGIADKEGGKDVPIATIEQRRR